MLRASNRAAARVTQLGSASKPELPCARSRVLLIFQAMDAAGKDGAIKHVTLRYCFRFP